MVWYISTVPDQTVPKYMGLPLMNGIASAGDSNEYSAGDHVHPHDTTKADAVLLNNYLLKAGNSKTDPMTGSIWLGSTNRVLLTDSGNSYIGLSNTGSAIELAGMGSGGVNLITSLGTAKYNGIEIATVNDISNLENQ